ncbi:hypothetical protein OEB99_09590 [Actinotalea sp. M2MS4P-6]|uniref:hypothetical protein n=1 Tax=Actinotalea sp. M2MS4P-6 TaxID=2983762 RepID=UPI0021E3DB8E|nr:hypothetical protein [Actinotalea sp. M2MS4P-6]MCV2394558.1 hypothetical protein [Actinotalea sp. M2MS4P-6]
MRRAIRAGTAALVLVSLAACTAHGSPEPGPTTSGDLALATSAPADAEVQCGVDVASVELATGHAVDSIDGTLAEAGDVGGGWCVLRGETLVSPVAAVRVDTVQSAEGTDLRARIDGDGHNPPDRTFPDLDGGVWGDVVPATDTASLGASSGVIWGSYAIEVQLGAGARGRDITLDLEALTRQVADSLNLGSP